MATNATQLAKSGKFGDLRRRLVFLLLALVVYRIGAHIPVPGINPDQLAQLLGVDPRDGNVRADPVDDEREQQEHESATQVAELAALG